MSTFQVRTDYPAPVYPSQPPAQLKHSRMALDLVASTLDKQGVTPDTLQKEGVWMFRTSPKIVVDVVMQPQQTFPHTQTAQQRLADNLQGKLGGDFQVRVFAAPKDEFCCAPTKAEKGSDGCVTCMANRAQVFKKTWAEALEGVRSGVHDISKGITFLFGPNGWNKDADRQAWDAIYKKS